jgi:hypothetical protein
MTDGYYVLIYRPVDNYVERRALPPTVVIGRLIETPERGFHNAPFRHPDLEQIIVLRPVQGVLADVLELERPAGVQDVDARDVLIDLAAPPFRHEDPEAFGQPPVRIYENREGGRHFALLEGEVEGEELAVAVHGFPAFLIELGRVGGIFPFLDRAQLFGHGFDPGPDDIGSIGKDDQDLDVVLLPELPGLLELDELGVLVVADRAPVVLGGISPGENDHDILSLEGRKGHGSALKGGKGEVRHGLADDHGLDLDVLGGREPAGKGQRDSGKESGSSWFSLIGSRYYISGGRSCQCRASRTPKPAPLIRLRENLER